MSYSIQKEGRIAFATAAIQKGQIRTAKVAATVYNVPRTTLRRRRRLDSIPPKRGSKAPNRKLSNFEEEVLLKWIYEMEQRGFAPFIINVRRMAEALIANRDPILVPIQLGKYWVYRFIASHPDLDPKLTRSFDS
jgi:hypothetical protein